MKDKIQKNDNTLAGCQANPKGYHKIMTNTFL